MEFKQGTVEDDLRNDALRHNEWETKALWQYLFQKFIFHGITALENRTSPKHMELLLRAYNDSLSVVLHGPILLAGLAFMFSLFLEWNSVKKTSK